MDNSSAVSALLVNERIAVHQQRLSSRDKIHNERRAGLNLVPSSKQTDKYDNAAMINICTALHSGRSGIISVTQLRSLKELLLHPQGVVSFIKDKIALHGLIGELSGKRPTHQLEAAYICINLGLGEEEQCLPVCQAAGPYLIQFIEGTSYHLQEASTWALGNLAGASNKCARIIVAQGAVVQLIQLLSGCHKGLSLAAAYALIHIIHSKAPLQENELIEIAKLLSNHLSTEADLCILLYLLSCFPVCEKTLLECSVVTKCIAILTEILNSVEKSLKTVTALLRTVGNLSSGDGGLEFLRHQGAAQLCQALSKAPYEHIRKETAWICANLICHQNEDVRKLAEETGLLLMLESFETSSSSHLWKPQ